MSPLPSPAGVAQTPLLAPVGSGHNVVFGSGLVAVKYGGSFGAGAAGAAAGAAALAGSSAGLASCAKDKPTTKRIQSPPAKDAKIVRYFPRSIFSSPFSLVCSLKSHLPLFPPCEYESLPQLASQRSSRHRSFPSA